VPAQARAEDVAVQDRGKDARVQEALLERPGERGLPRAGQPGHPDYAAAVAEDRRAAHQGDAPVPNGLLEHGVDDAAAADPAAPHEDEAPERGHLASD